MVIKLCFVCFHLKFVEKIKVYFAVIGTLLFEKKSGYRLLFATKTVGSYFPKIKMKYFNLRIVNVLRLVKLVLVKKKNAWKKLIFLIKEFKSLKMSVHHGSAADIIIRTKLSFAFNQISKNQPLIRSINSHRFQLKGNFKITTSCYFVFREKETLRPFYFPREWD